MTGTTTPGEGFSRRSIAATVTLCAGVGCINALQPILLGSMLASERLTVAQIGQAATAEAGGMAVAVTAAAILLPPTALRRLATMALVAMLVANSLTPMAQGIAILALRAVNGAGTGLLFWILVGMMGRVASPARLFAIYITVQSSGSLLLSILLTEKVVPLFGPVGGYGTLAVIDGLLLVAATLVPASYGGGGAAERRGLPPARGWLALLGIGSLLSGIICFWVYIVPLLGAIGYSDKAIHSAIPISIGFQIAGGLLASILANRLRPILVCIGGALICIAMVLTILAAHDPILLAGCMAVFAICWMGVPPFQMPLLIRIDPSLRTVLLIGSAQLAGLALGPIIASGVMGGGSVVRVAWVAIGFMIVSIIASVLAVAGIGGAPSSRRMPTPPYS